jgi:YD repeat-containing protein
VERYECDAAGNVARIRTPDPSRDDGALVAYTFAHDSIGRLPRTTRPDGTGLDVAYVDPESGAVPLVQTTTERVPVPAAGEPLGETVVRADAFGRQVEVKERLSDGGYGVTTYEHDGADQLVKIVDADGHITDLAHDFAGNRTSVVRGGRTWTYRYDIDDNMTAEVAP